jgi:hypothetical protein
MAAYRAAVARWFVNRQRNAMVKAIGHHHASCFVRRPRYIASASAFSISSAVAVRKDVSYRGRRQTHDSVRLPLHF